MNIDDKSIKRVFASTKDFEQRPRNPAPSASTYRSPVTAINYLRPTSDPDANGVQEAVYHEWNGSQFVQRLENVFVRDVNGNQLACDQMYIAFSSAPYSSSILWFTDIGEPGSGSGSHADSGDGMGDYVEYIEEICPIFEDIEVGESGSGGTSELVGVGAIGIEGGEVFIEEGGITNEMYAPGSITADKVQDGELFKNGDYLYAKQW